MGGWWCALVSPDGVMFSQMVSVSASVNLPLYHKVQKFSSGTGSPGWSRKKGRKMVVAVVRQQNCCTNFRYSKTNILCKKHDPHVLNANHTEHYDERVLNISPVTIKDSVNSAKTYIQSV